MLDGERASTSYRDEPGKAPRRRKTAAQRRQQQERSQTRMIVKLLQGLHNIQAHRGNQLSKTGLALKEVLERDSTPQNPHKQHQMPVCRHYQQHKCTWGNLCRFRHEGADTQEDKWNTAAQEFSPQPPKMYQYHLHMDRYDGYDCGYNIDDDPCNDYTQDNREERGGDNNRNKYAYDDMSNVQLEEQCPTGGTVPRRRNNATPAATTTDRQEEQCPTGEAMSQQPQQPCPVTHQRADHLHMKRYVFRRTTDGHHDREYDHSDDQDKYDSESNSDSDNEITWPRVQEAAQKIFATQGTWMPLQTFRCAIEDELHLPHNALHECLRELKVLQLEARKREIAPT